jgi:hypothetical protein
MDIGPFLVGTNIINLYPDLLRADTRFIPFRKDPCLIPKTKYVNLTRPDWFRN